MPNFYARIAEAAAPRSGRPAIEVVRAEAVETMTYGALVDTAGRFATWLANAGIGAGERVAILADNDARWIACYLGALRSGVVAVPLDTAYKSAQVRTVLTDSGARAIFTTPKYADTVSDAVAGGPTRVALLADADVEELPPSTLVAAVEPDDAAVMLYTSGTTADPKGVVLTHGNLDAERAAALEIVKATDADTVLGVLPLFHALAQMANLLIPLAVGARVVFLETVSSTSLLAALQTRGITIFACVPQFFYLIHQRVTSEVAKKGAVARGIFRGMVAATVFLRDRVGVNPGPRLFARVHHVLGRNMRMLVTGGSRFDPAIGRDLYGMGFMLLNAYGLTECSGGATIVRPGDRFTTSVGQAFPGVELRIAGDGEVLIRGPIVMREYFNRPDATAEALKDGWLYTGDLGSLDADGRLYITGRKKEIIVLASGKNLYPEEIEAHYRQSAFIKELCVLGLTRPGEPASERLHGVIVPDEEALRARGVVNVRELIRFEFEGLAVKLPAHKRILSYDIWLDPLPRTTTGKIKRHEVERRVRERAATTAAEARPTTDSEQKWLVEPAHSALVATIAQRLNRPDVRPDDNLELDLALDSMERVELLTALEQQRGSRVAADVRATIFTVRQLVEAVIAGLPAEAAAHESSAAAKAGLSTSQAWEKLLAEPPARDLVDNLARPKWIRAAVLYAIIRLLGVVARLWFGFRVSGREHVPARGPFIVCPNHQAYIDGFFLAAGLPFRAFQRIFFVGAAEYFQTPFMAWLARAINIVPVDPDANLVNAMRAGAAGLRLDKTLILFPEGERSIDGEIKRFRKGAAILSAHTGAPIVPVALDGLFEMWPRGRGFQWKMLLPWRAPRVRLAFGAPLVSDTDYARATDVLESKVGELFRAIH